MECLAGQGYQEVVLTGIHLSSYGLEWQEEKGRQGYLPEECGRELLSLFARLNEIPGIRRIRLGSLEPRIITPSFVEGLRQVDKLCPHFHLSLQSGCNATLARMNRHYTTEEYEESCRLLRQAFEHPAITTDVITGFAGETEEEFAQTTDFLSHLMLYEMHVFPFSVRKGTRAEKMPGQNTEQVKKERSRVLLEMTKEQSTAFRSYYVGKEVEVLLEETILVNGQAYTVGHTPEYVIVAFPGNTLPLNTIFHGIAKGFLEYDKILAEPGKME